MISLLAALLLQAAAPAPAAASPPLPLPARKRGKARAKTNFGSLFSNDDYPPEALRNEEEGTVGFKLQVGTDGLVKQCTITSPSGSAALDSATCTLLAERARFTPARNKRGRPIADTVAARVIWRIDRSGPPAPLIPMRFTHSILIGTSGEPVCTLAVNSEPAKPSPCPSNIGPILDAAREAGREVKQLFVTTLTPEGQAELSFPPDDGSQISIVEARIRAAPDGLIMECREVRAESMGLALGAPPPPAACGHFKPGTKLFTTDVPAESAVTVDYRARAYFRISD